jgi:hypothetical protein
MELSRICAPEIFESSNCCQNHPPPVSELLLGGIDNSPSKNFEQIEIPPSKDNPSKNTLLGDIENSPSKNRRHKEIPPSKNNPSKDVEQSEIPPSKDNPSKTRRHKGLGSGSIQWKTITLHGKDYPQAWYHYEFWKDGDRLVKKCKYIPKRLLSRIEKLEADKAPVRDILSILRVKF